VTDLRDRIAAALRTADRRVAGFIGYDEMADAVIAELGLKQEQSTNHALGLIIGTRWVTEWRAE
jgi:hypothetical protein